MSNEPEFDIEKLRSVGAILKHGRSKPKVQEYRDAEDGHRIKATTHENGTTVTEHNTPDDRQDVMIRPETIKAHITEIG